MADASSPPPERPDTGALRRLRRASPRHRAILGVLAGGLAIAAALATRAVLAPRILVGGSGTVMFGLLQPLEHFIEERSGCALPIEPAFHLGTIDSVRSLRAGEIELAAMSSRFTQAVPADLREADKVMVEIAIGSDETALFVHRDNPVRELDITAVRTHLCCGRDQRFTPIPWATLGAPPGPVSAHAVEWILFGRDQPPVKSDTTSATLLQADTWLCAPRQLCPSLHAVDVDANELLDRRVTSADVLALSTSAFATDRVVALRVIDRERHAHLDGRKLLWLYLAASSGQPLSVHMCRILDAILSAEATQRLTALGKAQGLPDSLRLRQRAALGLDDGTCAKAPLTARTSDLELADGLLASPVADELAVHERWIPD